MGQIIPQSVDDWNLYYQDSYFQVEHEGKMRWVHGVTFERSIERSHVLCYYNLADGGRNKTMNLRLTPPYNFDLSWPDCHYYFLDEKAKFLTRIPLRQNTKTMSHHNHKWSDPLMEIVPRNFWNMLDDDSRAVVKRLNANLSDFSLPNAIRMTNEKALTVPLKQEWCLSKSPSEKFSHLLWYRLCPVAYIDEAKQQASITNEIYRQEVIDSFGLEIQVK